MVDVVHGCLLSLLKSPRSTSDPPCCRSPRSSG